MDQSRDQLAAAVITVACAAAVMWSETPPWQRQMIIRVIRCQCRKLAAAIAMRTGRRAMGDELRGRQAEADAGYQFTYRLSALRDRL